MSIVSSLLPLLEPFLGIGFALNLAYVGLPRFRYRQTIQSHAADNLKMLGADGSMLPDTDWYKNVARLTESKGVNGTPSRLPKELWSVAYKHVFESKIDRFLAISCCVFFASLIFLGVGHAAGIVDKFGPIDSTRSVFSQENISFWYWSSLVLSLLPVAFVLVGGNTVHEACDYVDGQIVDMKKVLQGQVAQAPIPAVDSLKVTDQPTTPQQA